MADNKVPMSFRISPEGRAWLEEVAHEYHVREARVVRACLTLGTRHIVELGATLREQV